jgi:hypothetical protein
MRIRLIVLLYRLGIFREKCPLCKRKMRFSGLDETRKYGPRPYLVFWCDRDKVTVQIPIM